MRKHCVLLVVSALMWLGPFAFAKTHREVYQVSCDQLWIAVKDVVRNSGKYGIIGIDNQEMSISYNIGGGLGGKRINSVVLNRKGEDACEMQLQTAFSGLAHNDAGDFKQRLQEALGRMPKVAVNAAKKEVVAEGEAQPNGPPSEAKVAAGPEHGVVTLKANPEAVQISIDGNAAGSTPATLKLAAGKHKIRAVLDGYDAWEKEVEVLAESEINLKIVLKKSGS